ncbi:hypothetical protein BDA99DRAFT_566542 [Phascolomyces articulosus]|uniref:Uncharacterized protein n=1 Tax=Phascolomyces articulosus TaxID=60185 RepID=A0AAD5JZ05_9FUNG|nr:hypothetical protein BDA99DRAFT_566542 [Phascolomyces articulosus]
MNNQQLQQQLQPQQPQQQQFQQLQFVQAATATTTATTERTTTTQAVGAGTSSTATWAAQVTSTVAAATLTATGPAVEAAVGTAATVGATTATLVLPKKNSKITLEHIQDYFLGPACQVPEFYFKATYMTMLTMAETVLPKLTLACAHTSSMNSFWALNPLDKLDMVKDIENYLYNEMDKLPVCLYQENWLAIFLLYKVFAKYFSNSSQPTNNNRSVRLVSGDLLDVYHDASTPSSSSTPATSSCLNQPIFSIPSAPATLSPATPSTTTTTAIATTPPSSSSEQQDPPTLDLIIPIQDNQYPKHITINQPSPSPSSTTSSKWLKVMQKEAEVIDLPLGYEISLKIGLGFAFLTSAE